MALSITEANAVSSKYFDKTITSQVYEQSVLYSRLKAKNKVVMDGGTQLQWPIRYRELNQTEAVTSRQQVDWKQKETRTGAVLDWTYYLGKTMISWDERVKNTGKPQIVNLLKDKTDELNEDIYEKFCDDLYATSQGTNNIQALITIIDSGTTYAGIAVADAADWASTEDSSTTRLVLYGSAASLSATINATTFGKNHPDLIITSRNLYSKAESLIEPQKRYKSEEPGMIGFTNVKFHDVPIVGDAHCPAGYMFGIDTSQFELRYHPDYHFKVMPWTELEQAGFPNAMAKAVSWAGNIACRMRKTSFKYTALDYTL